MSSLRWNDDAALPSRQARDRFRLRRRRTVTGPLRTLPKRRRGSWVVSFALFSAAVLAVAITVVGFSERYAAMSAQQAEFPSAPSPRAATLPAGVAPVAARRVDAPVPAVRREAALPSEGSQPAVLPATDSAREVVAPSRPAAEASAFDLDRLPVLETAGMGLESDQDGASVTAAPARPSLRAGARRSAAAAQR